MLFLYVIHSFVCAGGQKAVESGAYSHSCIILLVAVLRLLLAASAYDAELRRPVSSPALVVPDDIRHAGTFPLSPNTSGVRRNVGCHADRLHCGRRCNITSQFLV